MIYLSFILLLLLDFMNFMLMLLFNLICMAFLTLLERKILGLIQFRMGPNKVGFLGLLQPFSDALKLLNKEFFLIFKMNVLIYNFMPMCMFFLSLLIWVNLPLLNCSINLNYSILLMLSIMAMNVYPVMLGGWTSNSNYSLLGSIRSIAQSISYEVSLFLIFFCLILLIEDYSLMKFMKFQNYISFMIFMLPIYMMFFISMLVELNRTPFDLLEGESELVSGFNIEYFSSMFTMIFMSEYLMIIFISMIMVILFFSVNFMSLKFYIFVMIHIIIIITIRAILPRIRYDQLMDMCWKKILLISLYYILINMMIKELIILNLS